MDSRYVLGILALFTISVFALVVISGQPPEPDRPEWDVVAGTDPPVRSQSYTTHGIINIGTTTKLLAAVASEGWAGSGTPGDPYVIEGYDINGSGIGPCITLLGLSQHIAIRNCYLHHVDTGSTTWSAAIRLTGCDHVEVTGNLFEDNLLGVRMDRDEVVIENNTFLGTDMRGDGLYLLEGTARVANNSFDDLSQAIYLRTMGVIRVEDNVITDCRYGIELWAYSTNLPPVTEFRIVNNEVHVDWDAVEVRNCAGTILHGNNISAARNSGVYIENSDGMSIVGNSLDSCGFEAQSYFGDTHHITTSNTINGYPVLYVKGANNWSVDKLYGQVIITNSSDIVMTGLTLPATFFGISLDHTYNVTITRNAFTGSLRGLILLDEYSRYTEVSYNTGLADTVLSISTRSHHNLITGNQMVRARITVGGPNNRIIANNLTGTVYGGISTHHTENCEIIGNFISANISWRTDPAIEIAWSLNITVADNRMIGTGLYLQATNYEEWTGHTISANNTVDGRPVIYRTYQTGFKATGSPGQLILANCSNFLVQDLNVSWHYRPLTMFGCSRATVVDCRFNSSLGTGIYVKYSDRIIVENCELVNSTIFMKGAFDSNITRCFVSGRPVSLENCDRLSISTNVFIKSGVSLRMYCDDNTITYNHFEGCSRGLSNTWGNWYDSGNLFHHNNFVDNNVDPNTGEQGHQCTDQYHTAEWDDGAEGNYWSDYRARYPGATVNGTTWSEPYAIHYHSSGIKNYDDHPLINLVVLVPNLGLGAANIAIDQFENATFSGTVASGIGLMQWKWEFSYEGEDVILWGNGINHTFDVPGRYSVKVTVTDSVGNVQSKTITVRVRDVVPPVAVAGDDQTIWQGGSVRLDGTGSTDNVGIVRWEWSCVDDGETFRIPGEVVDIIFEEVGTYTMTLTVWDAEGNTHNATITVTVRDGDPPVAILDGPYHVDQRETLHLDAFLSTDNVGIVRWEWAIEHDTGNLTRTEPSIELTYEGPGEYTVTLMVWDAEGNSDTVEVLVIVHDIDAPVAVASSEPFVFMGDPIILDGSASTDNVGIVSWEWRFLDESLIGDEAVVTLVIDEVGTGLFILRVWDAEGNTDSTHVTVEVRDGQPPVAEAGDDIEVDAGERVSFDGTASVDNVRVDMWSWSFDYEGEEVVLLGPLTGFTFDAAGTYEVTLQVRDPSGNIAEDTLTVTVREVIVPDTDPPVARVVGDITRISVKEGEAVHIDASASEDNIGVVSWTWTFEYNESVRTLNGPVIDYTFEIPGEYTVVLTVADATGLTSSASVVVEVEEATVEDPDPDVDERTDGPGFSLLIGMVALATALFLSVLGRRRRC